MQAYHRRRHRAAWVIIGIVVPIAILIALMGRKGIPVGEGADDKVTTEATAEP